MNLRRLLAITFSIVLIFALSSLHGSRVMSSDGRILDLSQANERERGIELYESGNTSGAIEALLAFVKRQKNDVRAWHFLGLALSRSGKTHDARNAFEKAAKIASQLLASQLDGLRSPKELYARMGPLRTVLDEGADSANKYLELSSKPSRSKVLKWRELEELLHSFAVLSDELNDDYVYGPIEVTTKARIISKPSPEYTEEARQNHITGTVTLLLILTADGIVKGFIPLARLPYGLTEKCISAARRIKFSPATMDGKPVSQFIRVEYNFNIY